jgi:two-component system response regulator CpxR
MIKILVVDDEKVILEEFYELLNEEGYHTFCAERVDEAIVILSENHDISLIVTDLKMPGKSGFDLFKYAKINFTPSIPFIFISGHTENKDDVDFSFIDSHETSAFSFIKKPIDINEFLDLVKLSLTNN